MVVDKAAGGGASNDALKETETNVKAIRSLRGLLIARKCSYYVGTSDTLKSNRRDGHDAIIQDICTSRTSYTTPLPPRQHPHCGGI